MAIDPLKPATRGSAEPAAPARQAAPKVVAVASPIPPSEAEVKAAVAQINQLLQAQNNNSLRFEIDRPSGKTVVRVIDDDTHEILRQFPSEEVLAIARAIPPISGALFKDTA